MPQVVNQLKQIPLPVLITTFLAYGFYVSVELFGRRWPVELLTHFYPQYALASLALGVLFVYRYGWFEGLFLILLSGLFMAPFYPAFLPGGSLEPRGDKISVSFLNVKSHPEATVEYAKAAREDGRDLVAFAGVTSEGRAQIRNVLEDSHPHQVFKLKDDVFGIGVASKHPLRNFAYAHEGIPESPFGGKNPWVKGEVKLDEDRWLSFWVIHPSRPTRPNLFQVRNSLLGFLAGSENSRHFPELVIGDFNVSPGSPYYRDIQRNEAWRSASGGNSLQATWPASFPPAWTAIDHAFCRKSRLDCANFSVGPGYGSDHYSITLDLLISKE